MLDTLRRIVQEVNAARNLKQVLGITVRRVRDFMSADVCTVFLTDQNREQHVLMATEGLNPDAVGKVRMGFDEGLVGVVAVRAEPINLGNAPDHPKYYYFPEIGEERFHGFLGVPIIHHRNVLGVLVVQSLAKHRFDEDSENFLITIAAQLAGAIAHAQANGEIDGLSHPEKNSEPTSIRPLTGQPGAPGIAIGKSHVVYPFTDISAIPDRKVDDIEAEVAAFTKAITEVKQDILAMSERLTYTLPTEDLALFDAYLLMLDSDSLRDITIKRIRKGRWAPGALRETIQDHAQVFDEMEDAYLRERADDVRDLGRRILVRLQQDPQRQIDYPEKTILVGEEITATMLADVPTEKLIGVISARGSRTSHVAILARAMGVPAVMGATDLPVGRMDDMDVVVDGYNGKVFVSPSKMVRQEYQRLANEEAALSAELDELSDLASVTQDGVHIPLYVNTGLLADITPSHSKNSEGVGLYRTEFPFMIRERFPGEDEQRGVYRKILEAFAPRPVVLRTLDVGGDKALPYFPIEEDNPFLGWRGIRITLDHPEIFLVQLRAMLLASIGLDNLSILLPMISDVSELTDALILIHRAYEELLEEKQAVTMPKVGVMIEVPSAVYQANSLAQRVDFFSIGTNDLTQYLLAVDRNNPRVAGLYDSLHPAVLRAMIQVVEAAKLNKKPVSVCGEMAGDPAAAILLVGMGVDSLSMNVSSLMRVKWVIRNLTRARAHQLLKEVLTMEEASSIREYLNHVLEDAGLGGLVRAGR